MVDRPNDDYGNQSNDLDLMDQVQPIYQGIAGVWGEDNESQENISEEEAPESEISQFDQDENPFIDDEPIDIEQSSAALASYYSDKFQGKTTCNGEIFDQEKLTLASHHWLGKTVCVSRNGKRITARINDCGPYDDMKKQKKGKKLTPHPKRKYDLSRELMTRLGGMGFGVVKITVQLGACEGD